ncbi:MAG: hypothetical protein U0271_36640 [Polyangiaceae bacterium]
MRKRSPRAREDKPTPTHSAPQALALPSGYGVSVTTGPEERLELKAPDGRVCLRIRLTEAGPELEVEAAALSVVSRGSMSLRAERLSIEAEKDLAIKAGGTLTTEGRSQHLSATHGDFHVEANDDVRLDGERVRLNAPEAAPLRGRSNSG